LDVEKEQEEEENGGSEGAKGEGSHTYEEEAAMSEVPMWYVCTETSDTKDTPLISPCNCKGGTKYVHVQCLRQWVIKDKEKKVCVIQRREGNNPYVCNVCKTSYKYTVKGKGKGEGNVRVFKKTVEPPFVEAVVLISSDETVMPRGTSYSMR